jgi:3-keto-5-aminohexanoate cleavage enzyme
MATFDAGTKNFGEHVFENSLPFLRDLAVAFREHGVKPEIECFDTGHILTTLRLRDEGLLDGPLHFQFVLGVAGGAAATTAQVLLMRSMIPADSTWSICGIGRSQLPMNMIAMVEGGHIRTGLEDNIYYRRGELADNERLVQRVVRIAREADVELADPDRAREILSIPFSRT